MLIIGCDYHPGFQQIAFVDTETGELQERRLKHREEAEKFYRDLAAQGMKVRVGMEASGHARWFERLLSELHIDGIIFRAWRTAIRYAAMFKGDFSSSVFIPSSIPQPRARAPLGKCRRSWWVRYGQN